MYGKGCFDFKCTSFQPCGECLEFTPQEWKDGSMSWSVAATEMNVVSNTSVSLVVVCLVYTCIIVQYHKHRH